MSPRSALIAVSFSLAVACSPEGRQPPSATLSERGRPAPAAPDAVRPPPSPVAPARVAATPTAPAVLEAIYQDPGNRSASYEVGNGSRATYWFGHTYEVGSKRYYTGFAEQSPDRLGSDVQDDPPSAKATLTQATFVSTPDNNWAFSGAQRFVGEVGARGRADAVDSTRSSIARRVAPGRLLLAVPTDSSIEQGTVQKNYELLLRAADGAWSHVGTVNAGQDDSAGCDEGRAFPCAPVTGRLSIDAGDGMPTLRVELRPGTTGSAPRTVIYRFDSSTSIYQAR